MSGFGVSSSELKSLSLLLDLRFCSDIQQAFREKHIREEAETCISFYHRKPSDSRKKVKLVHFQVRGVRKYTVAFLGDICVSTSSANSHNHIVFVISGSIFNRASFLAPSPRRINWAQFVWDQGKLITEVEADEPAWRWVKTPIHKMMMLHYCITARWFKYITYSHTLYVRLDYCSKYLLPPHHPVIILNTFIMISIIITEKDCEHVICVFETNKNQNDHNCSKSNAVPHQDWQNVPWSEIWNPHTGLYPKSGSFTKLSCSQKVPTGLLMSKLTRTRSPHTRNIPLILSVCDFSSVLIHLTVSIFCKMYLPTCFLFQKPSPHRQKYNSSGEILKENTQRVQKYQNQFQRWVTILVMV